MCGIVGAIAQRNVRPILMEGLKRLEYRGYDSAGLAVMDQGNTALRKSLGKVRNLEALCEEQKAVGAVGIAHTRWATHGKPSERNAHPHQSSYVTLVHNGIIENHQELRESLTQAGYAFISDTDSEVVVHQIHRFCEQGMPLLKAVKATVALLEGAYALNVISEKEPDVIIGVRKGCPLVIGVGLEENYLASDQLALRQVTDRFIYLDEGDITAVSQTDIQIWDAANKRTDRPVETLTDAHEDKDKRGYRHYMLKEMMEQPAVIANTLAGRLEAQRLSEQVFDEKAATVFEQVKMVRIIACGTSYHAGLVAKYWLEDWAGIPCAVEVASEYRYRNTVPREDALFVTLSQSGETADTLAALRKAKSNGYLASLSICNMPNSSLVRESDFALMTHAGLEVGVASTKAFTTQLVALQLLVLALGKHHGLSDEKAAELIDQLRKLPALCEQVLQLNDDIQALSEDFTEKHHALFLGRGVEYPIAMEGALKLKEISYIHAEAYPAGELKHGPLALIDSEIPIIAVAPNNQLLEKLKSNLEEVQARGGKLYVFADKEAGFKDDEQTKVIALPHCESSLEPIIYTLPLQMLSYHVAVNKGTDVDQPRNLAKSVTVE